MTPVKGETLELGGFTFVDDADILADANGKNDPQVTLKKMQETINCWEGVAKTTGGALAP